MPNTLIYVPHVMLRPMFMLWPMLCTCIMPSTHTLYSLRVSTNCFDPISIRPGRLQLGYVMGVYWCSRSTMEFLCPMPSSGTIMLFYAMLMLSFNHV